LTEVTSVILPIMDGLVLRVRFRSLVAVSLACLLLAAGCGSQPVRAPATYTVKRGDTLYSIAWRHGLDYREVARWNRIGRDYLIYPGQVLYLVPSNRTAAQSSPDPARAPPATDRRSAVAAQPGAAVQWSWPADMVRVTLTTRPNSAQGLTLQGQLGQQIRAAANGNVVYVGSGLLGYGQLVIIKHNDTYLSAYGHTQAVLVKEGDATRAGQPIATMGEGPGQQPMLYFEIRVNGQPVDPRRYLPNRAN
jgi:lipoprotein NlpD